MNTQFSWVKVFRSLIYSVSCWFLGEKSHVILPGSQYGDTRIVRNAGNSVLRKNYHLVGVIEKRNPFGVSIFNSFKFKLRTIRQVKRQTRHLPCLNKKISKWGQNMCAEPIWWWAHWSMLSYLAWIISLYEDRQYNLFWPRDWSAILVWFYY